MCLIAAMFASVYVAIAIYIWLYLCFSIQSVSILDSHNLDYNNFTFMMFCLSYAHFLAFLSEANIFITLTVVLCFISFFIFCALLFFIYELFYMIYYINIYISYIHIGPDNDDIIFSRDIERTIAFLNEFNLYISDPMFFNFSHRFALFAEKSCLYDLLYIVDYYYILNLLSVVLILVLIFILLLIFIIDKNRYFLFLIQIVITYTFLHLCNHVASFVLLSNALMH